MNTYRTKFFARCPANGVRIEYSLTIRTEEMIDVEKILTAVGSLQVGYHEAFADTLVKKFPGFHTLTAEHHGVTIETERP